MCQRCLKYGYTIAQGILSKRVRYSTGHLHHWNKLSCWAVDGTVLDTHRSEITNIEIFAWDTGEWWRISIADFEEYRGNKLDERDGGYQYFVEDRYWTRTEYTKPKVDPFPQPFHPVQQERLF